MHSSTLLTPTVWLPNSRRAAWTFALRLRTPTMICVDSRSKILMAMFCFSDVRGRPQRRPEAHRHARTHHGRERPSLDEGIALRDIVAFGPSGGPPVRG